MDFRKARQPSERQNETTLTRHGLNEAENGWHRRKLPLLHYSAIEAAVKVAVEEAVDATVETAPIKAAALKTAVESQGNRRRSLNTNKNNNDKAYKFAFSYITWLFSGELFPSQKASMAWTLLDTGWSYYPGPLLPILATWLIQFCGRNLRFSAGKGPSQFGYEVRCCPRLQRQCRRLQRWWWRSQWWGWGSQHWWQRAQQWPTISASMFALKQGSGTFLAERAIRAKSTPYYY